MLVTSRERLRVQGEQVWPVPQLSVADAVELFLAQARRLDVGYQPSTAVEELCARLDHLPLAIELAASRTAVFSAEQLLDRIGERLDLLEGPRDADPRQLTLRATIEWSYDLLDAGEQALLRSLSVFAGGCTFEAAEQVCDATPDRLQALLDKSLVRHRAAATGRRYFMLETIREFAAEQLDRLGLTKEVRLRHARYFDALGTTAAEEIERGESVPQWTERVVDELDNLRVASGHAAEIGDELLRLGLTTAFANAGRRHRADAGGPRDAARGTRLRGWGSAPVRARALRSSRPHAFVQGDLSAAKESYEDALDLHRAIGDDLGAALALLILGPAISHESGDMTEARRRLEESGNIFRSRGLTAGTFSANINLSHLLIQERDLAEATAILERALDEAPSDEARAVVLCNLGLSALLDDRPVAAAKLYRAGLERLQHRHDVDGICHLRRGPRRMLDRPASPPSRSSDAVGMGGKHARRTRRTTNRRGTRARRTRHGRGAPAAGGGTLCRRNR